jgi:hypothetical protein
LPWRSIHSSFLSCAAALPLSKYTSRLESEKGHDHE